jgi:hypothetical protein
MHSPTEHVGCYAQLPEHERENCLFQQDGATCHTSRDSMARVHEASIKWNTLCTHTHIYIYIIVIPRYRSNRLESFRL